MYFVFYIVFLCLYSPNVTLGDGDIRKLERDASFPHI